MQLTKFVSIFLAACLTMSFTVLQNDTIQHKTKVCALHDLDFDLVNMTGYDIENVYISPTSENSWGDDVMGKEILKDGEQVEIVFHTEAVDKHWDIYVTWSGYESDEDVYWTDFNLTKISEISLFYDAETGKTWAITK
ncbi:MAG: hypothetical protein IPO62_17040 [Saprospiraceae bacterium]|nr:hypothetical protein [Saprospiraceae bacterium]